MVTNLRSSGKNPLTSEQEMLEDRIRRMEESMARMTGLVETLVHNQSPLPLLTYAEHADVLRAQRRADDTAANLRVAGDVSTAQDEDSGSDPTREAHNSRRRRNAPAQKSTTRSGGLQLPADPVGPSRPAAGGETPAQPGSVFTRLGPLQRDSIRRAPARWGQP